MLTVWLSVYVVCGCVCVLQLQHLRVADIDCGASIPSAAVLGRALLAPSSSSTASDPARLRLPFLLSRMPNRDSSRASALSRFDTAEPAEVADWGGMRPAADEAEQPRHQDWRQAEVPLGLCADGCGVPAFD